MVDRGSMQHINRWSDWLVAQGRAEGTVRRYRYAVLRFLAEADTTVEETTEDDVIRFLASLGKRAHSRRLYIQALRGFFSWAAARSVVDQDPTTLIRPKAPTDPPVDAYKPEEVVALLACARAKSERRYLAMLLCYALGLRRSELCGITRKDVDWQGQRVYIREAKGGRPRWVEANALAIEAIEGLASQPAKGIEGSLVGMHPQWFTMIVHQAAAAAGLPPNRRRAHMLRAAFASHLIREGAPVPVVSRLLGHANISTTHRYAAVWQEDRRTAVDKLSLPGVGSG